MIKTVIVAYALIYGACSRLENSVNVEIAKGWEPFGSVSMTHYGNCIQAMVKKQEIQE